METKHDTEDRAGGDPSHTSAEEVFVFPTSSAQRRFWLVDQLAPEGNRALNVPLAGRLKGALDVTRLEWAINQVVQRHEILRTSLKEVNGDIVQVIHAQKTISIAYCDCTHWISSEVGVRLHEAMEREATIRFLLTEAPLLRARLLKLGESEHVLLLTTHHAVCDGWSQGILLQEVAQAYSSQAAGNKRAELPLQYADFAQWEEDWLRTPEATDQADYWKKKLEGALPLVNLPTDRPRRPGRAFPGDIHSALIDKGLVEKIKALCLKENLTPAMVYLAAYGLLLRGYSGKNEFVTGSTAANRGQTELEELIGFFANPILVRLNFGGNPTLRQILRRIRELSLEAFANQGYPFDKVVSNVQAISKPEYLQWLQVYFVYQRTFLLPQELGGLQLVPMHSVTCGALFEWTWVVLESEEGVRIQLEFDSVSPLTGSHAGLLKAKPFASIFGKMSKCVLLFRNSGRAPRSRRLRLNAQRV